MSRPGPMVLGACADLVLMLAVAVAGEADPGTSDVGKNVSEQYLSGLDKQAARLAAAVDAGARALIAEQPDAISAGDVAMLIAVFQHIGVFGDADVAKAREFAEMALERGVVEAGVVLAGLLVDFVDPGAKATDVDLAKAVAYLETAADAGSSDALRLLGLLYSEGLGGMEVDAARAEGYFLAAARHGDPEALMRLEPLFQIAAAERREHPERASAFPASAAEVVDADLVAAYERRQEELVAASAKVEEAMGKWLSAADADDDR